MAQLVMNWKNDGTESVAPVIPEGVEVKTFPELPNAVYEWLDIVRFMDQEEEPISDIKKYEEDMYSYPTYNDNMCYFLLINGVPLATITVICDYEKKEGYIHMVSSKPEFRGKGLGHLMNSIAVHTLKKEGMETAYLTTDDWRIAAIKTYLRAGFEPDLDSEPDYKERWAKIYAIIENK